MIYRLFHFLPFQYKAEYFKKIENQQVTSYIMYL